MTDEQRYYAKEEDYLEVFLDKQILIKLNPNILIHTTYENININTQDLNSKETTLLQEELGFNPHDIKVLSFWS